MEFQPVNPQMINANIANQPLIQTTSLRLVQGGSLLDKPTFGEKFMMGLKKFGSIFASIGSSILRFMPFPGAQVAAAGLYGVGQLAQRSYENQVAKRLNNLALDEAAAQTSFNTMTPGFGMFGSPDVTSSAPVSSFDQQKLDTVITREAAAREGIAAM
ncbi:MAG TPA: hypothetical protein VJR29_09535 [bacterium]|nr:hypothetical protein [bacterium]